MCHKFAIINRTTSSVKLNVMKTQFRERMWLQLTALGVLICLSVFAPRATAQDRASNDQPEQWVARLADPDPKLRQEAESKILAAGESSLSAVRAGMKSIEMEVSNRCKILLEKLLLQRRKRISAIFLAEDYEKEDLADFPTWIAFREFVKSEDIAVRKLFLKMCDELPSIFEDYELVDSDDAAALKKHSRLVLVPENNKRLSSVASTIGYLFLADQATKAYSDGDSKDLFNNVETLEAIQHFSGYANARGIRASEFRSVIESRLADWVVQWEAAGRVPTDAKFDLIFQTSNMQLVEQLNEKYESLNVEQRMKYIDIVSRATSDKKNDSWLICRKWLKNPLNDETIAVRSRVRKEPAKQIAVSVSMLAEGVMARAIKKSVGTGDPIKVDTVFGSFPLSSTAFAIVRNEKDRVLLAEYLAKSSHSSR